MADGLARRTEWWPGRRFADWLEDWFEWPNPTLREGEKMLRIEEQREDDALVIRAEIPGIDPEKDVDINVRDHTVEIRAERREEKRTEDKGMHHSEFRYGSFYRAVPLPTDASESDVRATYTNGILEIRVPCASRTEQTPRRIPVERT